MPQVKAKVIIVDDHPIVRQGLALLINQAGDLVVCAEAEDALGALEAIKQHKPNIVVVDLSLKESSGLDLIRDIRSQFPGVPTLVLSMYDESLYAERSLRAGARGYVMKQMAPEHVIEALRRVLEGEIYVSETMAARLLNKLVGGGGAQNASPLETLSDRELQVFQMIGKGIGTRQIAEELHLSVKTIETYRRHIKRKLGLKNATELVHHAIRWFQSGQAG
jgi:DNA-binding NarL/FixJ family response regulator